jgi:hypothetical protein
MNSIDKYGSICCVYGGKWTKMLLTLRGASVTLESLHMYVYIDITIVYDMLFIV